MLLTGSKFLKFIVRWTDSARETNEADVNYIGIIFFARAESNYIYIIMSNFKYLLSDIKIIDRIGPKTSKILKKMPKTSILKLVFFLISRKILKKKTNKQTNKQTNIRHLFDIFLKLKNNRIVRHVKTIIKNLKICFV